MSPPEVPRMQSDEPRWRKPAVCWPWRLVWSTFPDVVPDTLESADPMWGWFVQDLFAAEHPSGFLLDLGWYPDSSPDGAFGLELSRGDEVLEVHRGRDPDAIMAAIERICRRLSSPAPTTGRELLAAIEHEPASTVHRTALTDCPPGVLAQAAETTERADLAFEFALAGVRSGDADARTLVETWLDAADDEARASLGLQVLRAVDDQRASDAIFKRLGQAARGSPLRIALATALGDMSHPPHTRRDDDAEPPLPGSPRLVRVALGLPPNPPDDELDAGPFPLDVIERKLAGRPHRAVRLLERLAGQGEPRAVETLLLLRPPDLTESLQRWARGDAGAVSTAARRALARLTPSAAASAALAGDVHSASPVEQLLAIDVLAQQTDGAATGALLDALLVDDFFIRTTAWDALIARTGTPATTGAEDFSPLSALHLRVLTSLKAIWHPAASRARGLFSRLLAGEAHDAVLAAYVAGAGTVRGLALAALRQGGEAPIDVEPIRLLEGHDRAWFDAALLMRVGRQDVRAIAAGAALDVKGLAGALQEARKRWAPMRNDVREAIEQALLHLGASR